ncbi:putative methylesterase 11, chloroplastic isoform X2 [Aristolochia californica]|uniref:putative methylesterase 11, chloroplastic isoform X2 n=1 Tax=Aristolochia californica TaxID=171875 RepID=UPI0035DA6882
MGNLFSCFSHREAKKKPVRRLSNPPPNSGLGSSNRWSRIRSTRKDKSEETLIHEQALAAAILLQQNGGLPFDRSTSMRYPGTKKQQLPRSSSSRARSLTDPLLQPQQLVHQDLKLDDLETRHFVLVHGGGFGAWCWYKTIALLEEGGCKVDAIDLTGSGIDAFDTNCITSLSQYVKPLTNFMEKIEDGEKVILVGHDFGGACISYVMEMLPTKVAKAVFVSAAMLTNGQSTLDMFSQQTCKNDLMQRAQIFLYAKGHECPPTAIDLDKSLLRELLFNQSPSKRSMIESNPPEQVFRLKGSDHSPFFSKPQALHKLLVEIAKISSPKVRISQQGR